MGSVPFKSKENEVGGNNAAGNDFKHENEDELEIIEVSSTDSYSNDSEAQSSEMQCKNEVKSENHTAQDDAMNVVPGAENISEDELPANINVSYEELPGPTRAELSADTEVMAELPTVKNGAKRKSSDYVPGSSSSESEVPAKKQSMDPDSLKQKAEKPSNPKKLPELEKYWKALNDDPTDFTGWTYLLQYVDQEFARSVAFSHRTSFRTAMGSVPFKSKENEVGGNNAAGNDFKHENEDELEIIEVSSTDSYSNDSEAQSSEMQCKNEVKSENHTAQDDAMNVPGAENISEDELPASINVSDEELPGPTRAELSADTEVMAELPTVKNGAKRKSSDYVPGSSSSESEVPAKKQSLDPDSLKQKAEKPSNPKKLPELEKYWKAVNDDPTDFTGWTYLLQYVDQENDVEAAREVYDAFLSHYPYCYVYWRKYADYEKRKGNKKKCEKVFERGLKAIPLSVDLWIHYLTYVKSTRADDEDFVRAQFERAFEACGLDFRSDPLWDIYINWETEGKRLRNVTKIYDRLLATPTQRYKTHFDNLQTHIRTNPPNEILEKAEFLALSQEEEEKRTERNKMLRHNVRLEPVDNPNVLPGDKDYWDARKKTEAIRERIVSIRRKTHKKTANAVNARWNFERRIKRPYFDVKPLERYQLYNWEKYLDYEIAQGDRTRIVVLFERCLIACASYEKFWLRYVHYLEGLDDPDLQPKIKDVYERACTIHHLNKPSLHLKWAGFEESIGNFDGAAEILVNLEKSKPNVLEIPCTRTALEWRRGDYDKCAQLYEHYINNSKNKLISCCLAINYAHFCFTVSRNLDKAVEVLNGALAKDATNPWLCLELIDLTLRKQSVEGKVKVLDLIESFLEKETVDVVQKVEFAQGTLKHLERFVTDIWFVVRARDEYERYLKVYKAVLKVKDATLPLPPSRSNSNGNYGNYANSGAAYQYSGWQRGEYHRSYRYQYQNWQ